MALQIGDDVLEVSSFGDYMLNSVSKASLPYMMANLYSITHIQEDEKKHRFEVRLDHEYKDYNEKPEEKIVITTVKDLVSITIYNGTEVNFGESVGMMGRYEDGKRLARNGVTVLDYPIEFGLEWQVLQSEPSLFQATRFPQHPQECIAPEDRATAKELRRRLGEVMVSQHDAEKACAHWSDEQKDLCVFDVMAVNDLEIAAAGAY